MLQQNVEYWARLEEGIVRRIIGLFLIAGLVWAAVQLHYSAALLVDVSAKWACQCRFINGGDDAFCVTEDPLGPPQMDFEFVPTEWLVRVDIFGLYESDALYRAEEGCMVP